MNLSSLFIKCITTRSQLYNYQTVRFRRIRKPFWLGIAKSKMFVIPQPRILPEEERNVVNNLQRLYNTQLKALMNFIKVEDPKLKETAGEDSEKKLSPELEKKISDSYEVNNAWNSESARRREIRLQKSMEANIEIAHREMSAIDAEKVREMELIENAVRKEKELSKSYITPENLDEAVEKCLNNIDSFDFAIDLEGKRYPGRKTLLPEDHTTPLENRTIPLEDHTTPL